MTSALLGAHVSASGGPWRAFDRAADIEAECLQVFTRGPSSWKARPLDPEHVSRFRQRHREAGKPPVLAHDLYLTNLAASRPDIRQRSVESLCVEVERCYQLGLSGLVCHIGAHGGDGEEVGLERYAESMGEVLERTRDCPVPILLETTAGQGTCLGHRFEHLRFIIDRCQGHPRLGVCLDTCHVFAAGYDLSTEQGYRDTWSRFEQVIGLQHLAALHINDSKKPLGSRVDRHAHIGQGEIGQQAFQWLLEDPRLCGLPFIIETPDADTMHAVNLELLRSLRGSR